MSSEFEIVKHLNKSMSVWILTKNLCEQFSFNCSISNFSMFIFRNLNCNRFTSFFDINSMNNLPKCTCINWFLNFVPVTNLFTNLNSILTFFIRLLFCILNSYITNCIDKRKSTQLGFLKWCQFSFIFFNCFTWCKSFENLKPLCKIILTHIGTWIGLIICRHRCSWID